MSEKIEMGNRMARHCSDDCSDFVLCYNDVVTGTYPGQYQQGGETLFFGDDYTRWSPVVYNTSQLQTVISSSLAQMDFMNISGTKYASQDVIKNDLGGINIYPVRVPLQFAAVLAVLDPRQYNEEFSPSVAVATNIGFFNFAGYGNYLEWNGINPIAPAVPAIYESYSLFSPWERVVGVMTGILSAGDTDRIFLKRIPGRRSVVLGQQALLYVAIGATSNFMYPDAFYKNENGYPKECWRRDQEDVMLFKLLYTYYLTEGSNINSILVDDHGDVVNSLLNLPIVNFPLAFELNTKTIVGGSTNSNFY